MRPLWTMAAAWLATSWLFRSVTTMSKVKRWLATRYKGVDPEVNAIGRGGGDTTLAENFLMGTDAWNLPLQRQFNVQLQVRF